jgi:hypothetical protein
MEQILEDLLVISGLLDEDCQILRQNTQYTQKWVDAVVKEFYDTLYGYTNTAKVFREGERPHREETLHQWYLEVTSGAINAEFWQHQWFVGLVHIQRGVDNQFVLGILSRIQQLFLKKCLEEFEVAKAQAVFGAFERVTNVIAGLVVEGYRQQYLSAVERTSGITVTLIDRMAKVEANRMVEEARSAAK